MYDFEDVPDGRLEIRSSDKLQSRWQLVAAASRPNLGHPISCLPVPKPAVRRLPVSGSLKDRVWDFPAVCKCCHERRLSAGADVRAFSDIADVDAEGMALLPRQPLVRRVELTRFRRARFLSLQPAPERSKPNRKAPLSAIRRQ